MEFEVTATERVICTKCGVAFGRRKGNFYTCYAESYRGIGYLPICKQCIEEMFQAYLAQCRDMKMAVRQMCRKLDLYWSEDLFRLVEAKNTARTVMIQYLGKINNANHAKKSYDTTLMEEGLLWNFELVPPVVDYPEPNEKQEEPKATKSPKVPAKVMAFWGQGYTPERYKALEDRLDYWKTRLGINKDADFDIGTEAIIKEICGLELDIVAARTDGRPVDKLLATFNALLGSANLKPVQRANEENALEKKPLGVIAKIIEGRHPIAEPDPKWRDVDGIREYILTWYVGHAGKMLGEQNVYSKLYDEAIAALRVEHPELDDEEDDDEFLYALSKSGDNEG